MSNEAPTMTTGAQADAHFEALKILAGRFGDGVFSTARAKDNLRLYVHPVRLMELLEALKGDCGYAMLAELGATDYLGYPGRSVERPRYEVHYVLLNHDAAARIVVKAGLDDPDPVLPTSTALWKGANWMEREVYDMYGITFLGHPDLRRILMPDEFTAFPLRKDYPLRGRGERHNFHRLTRAES